MKSYYFLLLQFGLWYLIYCCLILKSNCFCQVQQLSPGLLTTVAGHLTYETLRLLGSSPTGLHLAYALIQLYNVQHCISYIRIKRLTNHRNCNVFDWLRSFVTERTQQIAVRSDSSSVRLATYLKARSWNRYFLVCTCRQLVTSSVNTTFSTTNMQMTCNCTFYWTQPTSVTCQP